MLKISKFQKKDAEKLSKVVKQTIRISLKKDYPQSVIQKLSDDYDIDDLVQLSNEEKIFIAVLNNQIVGTAAVLDNQIRNVFVHPNQQRKGVGKILVNQLEKIIKEEGYSFSQIPANPFVLEFYKKLGYFVVKEYFNEYYEIMEYYLQKNFE